MLQLYKILCICFHTYFQFWFSGKKKVCVPEITFPWDKSTGIRRSIFLLIAANLTVGIQTKAWNAKLAWASPSFHWFYPLSLHKVEYRTRNQHGLQDLALLSLWVDEIKITNSFGDGTLACQCSLFNKPWKFFK